MSGWERSGTDPEGHIHVTVSYPFARTIGCSCGWVRKDVDPSIHDDLADAHLDAMAAG